MNSGCVSLAGRLTAVKVVFGLAALIAAVAVVSDAIAIGARQPADEDDGARDPHAELQIADQRLAAVVAR